MPGANALLANGPLQLLNSGKIIGDVNALSASGSAFIDNEGTITGTIQLGAQSDTLHNTGLVEGNVLLGNSSNIFQSLGGFVTGLVAGGTGNDQYLVDQTGMRLEDAGGFDVINTSVNFQMAFGIEEMFLHSATGLVGTGSDGDDAIQGDLGDDTLIGLGGNDDLEGADGNNWCAAGRVMTRWWVVGAMTSFTTSELSKAMPQVASTRSPDFRWQMT